MFSIKEVALLLSLLKKRTLQEGSPPKDEVTFVNLEDELGLPGVIGRRSEGIRPAKQGRAAHARG